jgi:hypothetical protein
MKKVMVLCLLLFMTPQLKAWWDPGHLIVAMIAYMRLNDKAKAEVDRLTFIAQEDYPYLNHFITLGGWPDDLKAEGVRTYDTWHYTNIPYNPDGVSLPNRPDMDVVWAINQMQIVMRSSRSRDVDKARHLGFLVHFVGDIHQPLHSTTYFSDDNPSGDQGGNEFNLQGNYRNLHSLWDDGCGFLTEFADISPYGVKKEALTTEEIERYNQVAMSLLGEFDVESCDLKQLDPDFWALESHKLAIKYGYRGHQGKDDRGRNIYLKPGEEPTEIYLDSAQKVVKSQLVTAGLRLGEVLNELYGKEPE